MSEKPAVRLQDKASEAAGLLALIANEKRLLALCHLGSAGEMTVGALCDMVGLSQSALSQHLALLRAQGIVATRREGVCVHYSLVDPRVLALMESMRAIFCPEET